MKTRGCVFATCVMVLLCSSVVTGTGAGAIPASGCTKPIVISRLAFGPGTVLPSQKSTVRLAGRNCTRRPQPLKITWSGRFSGDSVTGCPAIDPAIQSITVKASSAVQVNVHYNVPKPCAATLLTVNAKIADKTGKIVSNKTASLRIAHKPVKPAA